MKNKNRAGWGKKLLLAGTSLFSGGELACSVVPEVPKPTGNASVTVASDYVARSGFKIGSGPVSQCYVEGSAGNTTGYIWASADLTDEKIHEVDVGIRHKLPLSKSLTARFGYDSWNYPSGLLGDEGDSVFIAGLNYTGPVNLDVQVDHISAGQGKGGTMVYGNLSRDFDLGELGNWSFSITPSLRAAYLDNFYGVSGVSHVTPRIDLKVRKGSVGGKVWLARQNGFNGMGNSTSGGVGLWMGF